MGIQPFNELRAMTPGESMTVWRTKFIHLYKD